MGRLAVRRAIAQMEQAEQHVFSTTMVSHTLLIRSSCGAGTGIRAGGGAGTSPNRQGAKENLDRKRSHP
jgi:hypothetical protein